jgi:hypothetical protein
MSGWWVGVGEVRANFLLLQDDIVCAYDAQCPCQLSSDHLSYGLMDPVQDLIFEHVVSMM